VVSWRREIAGIVLTARSKTGLDRRPVRRKRDRRTPQRSWSKFWPLIT